MVLRVSVQEKKGVSVEEFDCKDHSVSFYFNSMEETIPFLTICMEQDLIVELIALDDDKE